jgi:hypothetical protein
MFRKERERERRKFKKLDQGGNIRPCSFKVEMEELKRDNKILSTKFVIVGCEEPPVE